MSKTIFLLNGPNLNLLGFREPEIYGHDTLADVEARCMKHAETLGVALDCRQTNHEGVLVDWIQEARGKADAIILNAGAYTHTSIAIHDALKAYDGFKMELHISDPKQREAFRHISYVELASDGLIAGKGVNGYIMALDAVMEKIA
ncbi:MAG: 3-dehydroquinate dehydratase [Rhodobacteraceae bacterium]|nr:MAG: 3-dehydroquinate dehydratase [Paracoccaceae bacterium]